ncbi:MAG: hypothetical protein LBU61_00055 [Coriobacteriales bacterium]|jgi:hypothetical protein|nr:hypothetical protein [Coriobacteriales bacterium]
MKTCPYCQSVSFDDAETCFGCLFRFDVQSHELPVLVNATSEDNQNDDAEVTEAITLSNNQQTGFSGMARLHVKMPQGYHYDVYLEKPEGASIQIGWIPDPEPVE